MRKVAFYIFIFVLAMACNKPDNFRPVIEYVIIDGINTENLENDTVYNTNFPFNTEFRLTDNIGVVEYRFEFIRPDTNIADLHILEIKKIGSETDYTETVIIDFELEEQELLETHPAYYNITIDCYDESGNVAIQHKSIVEIIPNLK